MSPLPGAAQSYWIVPDGNGVRPLAHAEERGYRAIADLLRAAGARR